MSALTTERFLSEVADHIMTIEIDEGVHRSLKFGQAGSSCMHFRLNTFPGHICYTGDMGSYVFSRLHDMFDFFRQNHLKINADYWSEKLVSVCKNGGDVQYNHEHMVRVVKERLSEWECEEALQQTQKAEATAEINMSLGEISGCRNTDIPINTMMQIRPDGFEDIFEELYEYEFEKQTFRLDWCMHAIVWGIQQYDAAKNLESAA